MGTEKRERGILFIGWVEPNGAAFARTLREGAHCVLQDISVRLAPKQAVSGAWQSKVIEAIRGADAALFCVTKPCVRSAWLHFQLGASYRLLGSTRRPVPVLLDLASDDLASTPFALFQAAECVRTELRSLARDLELVLIPRAQQGVAIDRFEQRWSDFEERFDLVPGDSVGRFEIVLALPGRLFHFPFEPGRDGLWDETAGRMIAALPSSPIGIPQFDMADLRYLDLSTEQWIRLPRLLSHLQGPQITLVHKDIAARWHENPKGVAKYLKHELQRTAQGPRITLMGTV